MYINVGKDKGLAPDMAVVHDGLVGIVDEVYDDYARVLLLSSPASTGSTTAATVLLTSGKRLLPAIAIASIASRMKANNTQSITFLLMCQPHYFEVIKPLR